MTDVENDESEGLEEFITNSMENQILATLVHNLQRLDESVKQESEGVHNTLGKDKRILPEVKLNRYFLVRNH